ncbi:hypothetical protein BBJ29_001058 [Phytophthora kernoviae]|uniref:Probable pectate lyase F n=1 Tax=Phytophthora kernoviae TaxID=325452 RepID=A0A3F2RVR0_9STRA|nr:hypothetical protein BBJ29_001058 [Phytophthora kernoviae]RLN65156.1 hypothetical protein BBP00_00003016 [Phytophthora kernoviae]
MAQYTNNDGVTQQQSTEAPGSSWDKGTDDKSTEAPKSSDDDNDNDDSGNSWAQAPVTSWGTVEYTEPYTIKAGEVFDGKMQTFDRSDITCSEGEGQKDTAVFLVEAGGTLKSAIIGKNQKEGATLSNIWVKSSKKTVKICQWSQGNADGEPTMLGDGPSGTLCQYSESDIHLNGDVSQAGGSSPIDEKSDDEKSDNEKSDGEQSDDDNTDSTQQQTSSDGDSAVQQEVSGEAAAWNSTSSDASTTTSTYKASPVTTGSPASVSKKCNIRRKRN